MMGSNLIPPLHCTYIHRVNTIICRRTKRTILTTSFRNTSRQNIKSNFPPLNLFPLPWICRYLKYLLKFNGSCSSCQSWSEKGASQITIKSSLPFRSPHVGSIIQVKARFCPISQGFRSDTQRETYLRGQCSFWPTPCVLLFYLSLYLPVSLSFITCNTCFAGSPFLDTLLLPLSGVHSRGLKFGPIAEANHAAESTLGCDPVIILLICCQGS